MASYQSLRAGEAEHDDDTSMGEKDNDSDSTLKGLSAYIAGAFIVAEIAGAGVLALPKALSSIGYPGLILFFATGIIMLYTGVLLGRCWLHVYGTKKTDGPIRDPYPFIAETAFGKFARFAVIFLIIMHCFFVATVYLIMPAQMISTMLHVHIGDLREVDNVRLWSFFFALVITPLTWFDSPKDNWFVAILGSLSTMLSVICIIGAFFLLPAFNWKDVVSSNLLAQSKYPVEKVSVSLGVFISAFTGAVIFPTIQSDMKKPGQFVRALILGYMGCFAVYLPVMLGGDIIFQVNVKDNVLLSLIGAVARADDGHAFKTLVYIAVSSFLLHFVTGTVIQSNPINQLMESYTDMPEGCSIKRCLLRSVFMVIVLIFAIVVPNFTPILSFLGGTINMFLSIIFPVAFYLALHPQCPKWEKLIMYCIIVIGLFLSGLIGFISARGMYNTVRSS